MRDGQKDKWANGQMDKWTDGWTKRHTSSINYNNQLKEQSRILMVIGGRRGGILVEFPNIAFNSHSQYVTKVDTREVAAARVVSLEYESS